MAGPTGRFRPWYGVGLIIAVCVLDFLVTGIRVVSQNEQGVVLRFGRVVAVRPAGIHVILPYPVETMRLVRTTEVRTMPVGFKLVDQLSGVPPTSADVQWLTGNTNIVEIQTVVQYVVRDPVQYLFRVADLSDGRRRDFVLRKIAESVLTALVAHMTVDDVLSVGKARLQEDARQAIQTRIETLGLGLQVVSVNIVENNPPPEVKAAFNDVSSARADRERMINEADGYAKELLPQARAQAQRTLQEAEIYRSKVVSTAKGAAHRFRALAAEVRAAPEVSKRRLWLEMVEQALSQAKIVIYSTAPGEHFSLTQVE